MSLVVKLNFVHVQIQYSIFNMQYSIFNIQHRYWIFNIDIDYVKLMKMGYVVGVGSESGCEYWYWIC